MNALDVAIAVALLVAGVGGWRLGFLARLFAWFGVGIGIAIGVHFVPRVVTAFGGTNADDRVTVAIVFLVLLATLGQALGLGIGLLVHRRFPLPQLPRADKIAGVGVGVIGVLVLVWMVTPALATASGWPARLTRGSWVVARIQQFAPEQPAQFAAWGRSVANAPYPSALGPLDEPPDPGSAPNPSAMSPVIDALARASTVKVSGHACREIQEGSGWVTAPETIVTNAHVVAGERSTSVTDATGIERPARVVAFDAKRDLAVLVVPGLTASPLPLDSGSKGDEGAVYGHPGGGALTRSPARIGEEILAVGTDITRTSTSRRHVYVLAASLAPGDSGGPFVDTRGKVVGVAFAIDPGRKGVAYALTDAEVRPVLTTAQQGNGATVSTGKCLAD